jgi:hypothetical protein
LCHFYKETKGQLGKVSHVLQKNLGGFMKKIFLVLLFLSSTSAIHAADTIKLQHALAQIEQKAASANSVFLSENYFKQIFKEIHTLCVDADPNSCKSDHLTGFGVLTLVGSSASVGVLATLAVQRSLHILNTRS